MKKADYEARLLDVKRNAEFRNRITNVLFATGYPDYALVLRSFHQVVPMKGKFIGGTDYTNLYINEDLTDDELSIVVRHEILHVMLRHNKRAPKGHKRNTWNMACDYELSNYYSVYDNHVLKNSERLHDGCYIARHSKYGGRTASQIYDLLIYDLYEQKRKKEQQNLERNNIPPFSGDSADNSEDFDMDDLNAGSTNPSEGESMTAEMPEDMEPDLTDEQTPNNFDNEMGESEEGESEGEEIDSEFDPTDDTDSDDEPTENEGEVQNDGEVEGEFDGVDDTDPEFDEADFNDAEEGDNDTEFDPFDSLEDELEELTEEMKDEAEKEASDSLSEEAKDLGESDSDAELEEQLRKAMELALKVGYNSLSDEQKEQMEGSELVESTASGKSGLGVEMKPPKIDEAVRLKYQLKSYFIKQEQVDKGRTYRRPNKKYAGSPFIVKGKANVYKPSKTIACYVDVSGSMSRNMVKRALEVVEGLKKIKRLEVKIHYFNTQIHDKFRSGGGTDYNAVLDHATENKYSCIAVITDNSYESWRGKWKFEAVWLIGIERCRDEEYAFARAVDAYNHPNKRSGYIQCKKFQFNEVLPNYN